MEVVRIEVTKEVYESIIDLPHKVIAVNVKDEIFENDPMYDALKKSADSAYKKLDEYKFKRRHNIL